MHCRALHSGGALIKGNSGWDNDVVNDDDKDVEDDDDNRGLIKAGAEWWVRLWWQLLSQEQISSLLPPLITEAALIINNCIALITETWTHNGTLVQLALITCYTSSFLVPNLDPVLCLLHLSTPSHYTNWWNILLVTAQHVQMVAAFCFRLGFTPGARFWALL